MTGLSTYTLNILSPFSLQLHVSIPCTWHLSYIPFSTLYVLLNFISENDIFLIFLLTPTWLIMFLGMICILFSLLTSVYFIALLSMASLLSSLPFFHFYTLQLSHSHQTYIFSCFPLRCSYCLYMTCLIFFLHKFTQVHLVPVYGISLLLASLFYSCSTTKLCSICIFPVQWYVCFILSLCMTSPSLSIKQLKLPPSPITVMHKYCVWMTFSLSLSLYFLFSTCVHFSYLLNSTSLLFYFCTW